MNKAETVTVGGTLSLSFPLTFWQAIVFWLKLGFMGGDDHEMLRHGLVLCDALIAWCKSCQNEPHFCFSKV